jgi:Fic family protein
MKPYNWQQPDWPHFRYDLSSIEPLLLSIAEKTGSLYGQSMHLDASLQTENLINQLMIEVIKTSETERPTRSFQFQSITFCNRQVSLNWGSVLELNP